ncbi:hypothetical protein BH10PSE19_BH10PSE19_01300 [soil metagenome]
MGEIEEALENLRAACTAQPRDNSMAYGRALLCLHDRDNPRTFIELGKALQQNPNHVEALVMRAEMLLARGAHEAAVTPLQTVMSLLHIGHPLYNKTALSLVNAYRASIASLTEHKSEVVEDKRSASGSPLTLAKKCLETGMAMISNMEAAPKAQSISNRAAHKQYGIALQYFTLAKIIAPDFMQAYTQSGQLLHKLAQPVAAIREYDAALAKAPRDPHVLQSKGLALWQLGDQDAATRCFDKIYDIWQSTPMQLMADLPKGIESKRERSHSRDHKSSGPLAILLNNFSKVAELEQQARELRKSGSPAQALTKYQAALAILPNDVKSLYGQALVLEALDRNEEALASLFKAQAYSELYCRQSKDDYSAKVRIITQIDKMLEIEEAKAPSPAVSATKAALTRRLFRAQAEVDNLIRIQPDAMLVRTSYEEVSQMFETMSVRMHILIKKLTPPQLTPAPTSMSSSMVTVSVVARGEVGNSVPAPTPVSKEPVQQEPRFLPFPLPPSITDAGGGTALFTPPPLSVSSTMASATIVKTGVLSPNAIPVMT